MINNKHHKFLISLSGISITLVLFRVLFTGSLFYVFLIWNLFLASVPYLISQYVVKYTTHKTKKWFYFPIVCVWLLFLPNAPYIITDLIHLNHATNNMIWYDAFMIFIFACNGLILGILSMHDMYKLFAHNWNIRFALICMIGISFLAGFGIYLGRFLRWNSWELFMDPLSLLYDVKISLLDPKYRLRTWWITCSFGGLLSYLWLCYKSFLTTNKSV